LERDAKQNSSEAADAGRDGQPLGDRRDVTLATFMEVLDTSIANVALPHIAGNLSAGADESTWVLTSYWFRTRSCCRFRDGFPG